MSGGCCTMQEKIIILLLLFTVALISCLLCYHILLITARRRARRVYKLRHTPAYSKIRPFLLSAKNHAIEILEISPEGITIRFLLSEDIQQTIFLFQAEGIHVSHRFLETLSLLIDEDFPLLSDISKYQFQVQTREACNGSQKNKYLYSIRPSYRNSLEYFASNNFCIATAIKNIN